MQGLEPHLQGGDLLTDPVVDVTGDPPPLLVLCRDEASKQRRDLFFCRSPLPDFCDERRVLLGIGIELLAQQVGLVCELEHRLRQPFVDRFVKSTHLGQVRGPRFLIQSQHGSAECAKLREHGLERVTVQDAVSSVKPPGGFHRTFGAAAL